MKIQKIKTNYSRGITLIALVITIIVLLILAGVTISALSGDNGILTNATKAKEETEIENEKEQIKIATSSSKIENNGEDITEENMKDCLIKKQGNNANVLDEGENLRIEFNDTGRQYIVNKKTGAIVEDSDMVPSEGIAVGEKAEKNTTINGKAVAYNNPIIPKGFMAVDTETAKWNDSNGWENGLVIEDVTGDLTTSGSQFVWIPVQDYDNFHLIEGYQDGLLQNYLTQEENASREPGSNDSMPFLPSKPNPNNTTKGSRESIEMYQSVKSNGGFYIARYEAGLNNTTQSTEEDTFEKQIQNGTVKPVSKKGVGVWNNIPWGGTYTDISPNDGLVGDDTKDGAVKVARCMYNNVYIGINNSETTVKSTLCYGVQWDAVMNFIDDRFVNGTAEGYVKDGVNKGNFSGVLEVTGAKEDYKIKNIYDMAGNVYEWTMEAYGAYDRTLRGNHYLNVDHTHGASIRSYWSGVNTKQKSVGFRISLYI